MDFCLILCFFYCRNQFPIPCIQPAIHPASSIRHPASSNQPTSQPTSIQHPATSQPANQPAIQPPTNPTQPNPTSSWTFRWRGSVSLWFFSRKTPLAAVIFWRFKNLVKSRLKCVFFFAFFHVQNAFFRQKSAFRLDEMGGKKNGYRFLVSLWRFWRPEARIVVKLRCFWQVFFRQISSFFRQISRFSEILPHLGGKKALKSMCFYVTST